MFRWLRTAVRAADDARGIALVTVAFVLFAMGMMLFGFVFLNENEASFAGVYRTNTTALGLAEAGIQEAIDRVNTYGRQAQNNGTSQFPNSLATSAASPWSTGTVYFEPALQNNPQIFPILSTATFLGQRRSIRIFEYVSTKTGTGNIIFGPQVQFNGDAHQISGDAYSMSSVTFQQYQKSPLCDSGATPTNLIGRQVMSGTTIGVTAVGPSVTPPCGAPTTINGSPYAYECQNNSMVEVPPTSCPGSARSVNLPYNWHPMTPIGMPSTDFTYVMNAVPGQLPAGVVNTVQASKNGTPVTYSPVAYTPSYWTTEPATNGKVMLVTISQAPICVNASLPYSTGLVAATPNATPPPYFTCPSSSYHMYGNYVGAGQPGIPGNNPTRFIDWGVVADDLTRANPQTFYQAPTPNCTAPCANQGNQNGIRYIPAPPPINIMGTGASGAGGLVCLQNMNPGTNVFDPVITRSPAVTCPNPPVTTIASSTAVTFTGTYSNPESLIIDNAGGSAVTISPSINGPGSCSSNFTSYNVGIIMATGDLSFSGNMVFSGYIYTPGNINTSGTVVFQGGVFSANISNNQVNQVDSTGNVSLCAGPAAALPQTSTFFTFSTVSWEDRGSVTPP